jgi:predicted enzyme related to lactoylglutathione lyase
MSRSPSTTALSAAVLTIFVLAIGCSSSGDDAESADAPTTSTEANATTTTAATSESEAMSSDDIVEMTIPDVTTPAATAPSGGLTGSLLMLKVYVGDLDEAEAFYGAVFGATSAMDLGDVSRVLTFPDGPGIIINLEGADHVDDNTNFIMQVPDLEAAVAAAEDHGATYQQGFHATPGGQEARSVDLLDPWGNQIEILQLG